MNLKYLFRSLYSLFFVFSFACQKSEIPPSQLIEQNDGFPLTMGNVAFPSAWPGPNTCISKEFCYANARPYSGYASRFWAFSETDAWLIGSYGLLLHFDGMTWNPVPVDPLISLQAITGFEANQVFVASTDTLFQCTPQKCTPQAKTFWENSSIQGVWANQVAPGKTDVWLYVRNLLTGRIYHFDGISFSFIDVSSFASSDFKSHNFVSMWGYGPDDVWIGVTGGPTYSEQNGQIGAFHFDGTKWETKSFLAKDSLFFPLILPVSKIEIWLIGPNNYTGSQSQVVTFYKGDGTTFNQVSPTGIPSLLYSISAHVYQGKIWLLARLHDGTNWLGAGELDMMGNRAWKKAAVLPSSTVSDFWVLSPSHVRLWSIPFTFFDWDGIQTKRIWQSNPFEDFVDYTQMRVWGLSSNDYWIFFRGYKEHEAAFMNGKFRLWHVTGNSLETTSTLEYTLPDVVSGNNLSCAV